jgi:FkbM family methyltransferase
MQALERFLYRLRPALLAALLKRVFRVKRRIVSLKAGTRLWIDPVSHLGQEILETGHYEPLTTEVLETVLRPGDCFIDMGANEGVFTVAASRLVGSTGKVISVEPQQRLKEVIEKNLEVNRSSNVTLETLALSNSPGTADLVLAHSVNTGASSLFTTRNAFQKTQPVRTETVDHLLERHGLTRARLAKIDCEGGESLILEGASKALTSQLFDYILIEFHPHLTGHQAPKAADRLLRQAGYCLTRVRTGHWLYHLPELPEISTSLAPSHPIPPEAFH